LNKQRGLTRAIESEIKAQRKLSLGDRMRILLLYLHVVRLLALYAPSSA